MVITGAGGGLGRALVAEFSAAGARVTACDRDSDALAGLQAARLCCFDLRDHRATATAVQALIAEAGAPDVLINNAGWTRAETMESLTPDNIAAEVELNLTSVMALTSALVAAMVGRGGGSLVFISSVNALAHFGNPAYAAAKAGIDAFARAVAVEHGRHGIRANTVCPGSVRTPAWDHRLARDPTIMGKLARLYPLGRIVESAEVVAAVLFLASNRASGITGVTLPVDAGLTAGNMTFINDILGAEPM